MLKAICYGLARGDSLVRWRDRLAAVPGVVAESPETFDLTYCDSFDWRLYRAGLRLECRVFPRGTWLRLITLADEGIEQELLLDSVPSGLAADLPPAELTRCLKKHLGIRAFLPLARLRVRRYQLCDKDSEGKTRARLYLEALRLKCPQGNTQLLSKQICLQPLRGYRKAARTLSSRLQNDFELAAGDAELYRRSLAAFGRVPGDYSSKFSIDLTADMRTDAALRKVLLILLSAMQANEQGAIEVLDSEFLHDFRVAVRRTRSVLGVLKRAFPVAGRTRFMREFAWLGSVTGEPRDLDVYVLNFDSYSSALPEHLRAELEALRGFLRFRQRCAHYELLRPVLESARYRKLKAQWARYLQSPLARRPAAADAMRPVGAVARERSWHVYKRVLREGAGITTDSPPEQLHELRKSCKKLRYLLEAFQSLYPPKSVHTMIRELKLLQDNLGEFQDLDVQINRLGSFAMEMRRRGECTTGTGKALEALQDVLGSRMVDARAAFGEHFARFSQPANKTAFRAVLHSVHPGIQSS